MAELKRLLEADTALGMTPFARLKAVPVTPKANHVRELLERLRRVRGRSGSPAGVQEARLELKSGCHVEAARLRTAERLTKLIAEFCILSWRIFWTTMVNRIAPDVPSQ